MNKDIFRFFTVYGSYAGERNYRQNKRLGIVAKGIEQAVTVAKELHPEITIFDISHHGLVDIIDSEAEILVTANVADDGVTFVSGQTND